MYVVDRALGDGVDEPGDQRLPGNGIRPVEIDGTEQQEPEGHGVAEPHDRPRYSAGSMAPVRLAFVDAVR